jgi:hypothetical protein
LIHLEDCFFISLDYFSLRKGTGQRGHNVNMVGNTVDAESIVTLNAANSGQVGMHSKTDRLIQERLAISCAKDDVQNDFAQ